MTIYHVDSECLSPLLSLHRPYLKPACQLSVPPKPPEGCVPPSVPPRVQQHAGYQSAKPRAISPSSVCSPPVAGVNTLSLSSFPYTYMWCTLPCAVYTSRGCMGRWKKHVKRFFTCPRVPAVPLRSRTSVPHECVAGRKAKSSRVQLATVNLALLPLAFMPRKTFHSVNTQLRGHAWHW